MVCRRLLSTFSSLVFDSPHLHVSFDVALLTTSPLLLRALKVSTRRGVFVRYTSSLGVCLVFRPSQELITPAMSLRFLAGDCIIRH